MANRDYTTVLQSLEKLRVFLSCRVNFGVAGAPSVLTANSLGILAVTQFTTAAFTATGTSTTSITGVSNFTNLYNGMILKGTNVAANSVISNINAGAGTLTLSQATTGAISSVSATGGYQIQFGKTLQNGASLDTYPKFLGMSVLPDENGLQGSASTQASSPTAPHWFMFQNTISSNTPVTGASVYLMCGYYTGNVFTQINPANGERAHMMFSLGNSTAA